MHYQGYNKKNIWHDVNCATFLHHFICEIDNSTHNTTDQMEVIPGPTGNNVSKSLPVFLCHSTKHYISTIRVNDAAIDCPNAEDELLRSEMKEFIDLGVFRCQNGTIISLFKLCDHVNDCWDAEDELDCRYPRCHDKHHFMCSNKECIEQSRMCDGIVDCKDSSDEIGCYKCSNSSRRCVSGTCIPHDFYCDRYIDCAECALDEINAQCDITKFRSIESSNTGRFTCKSGQQVAKDDLCIMDYKINGHMIGCRDQSHLDSSIVNCHQQTCPKHRYSRCPRSGYCIPHEYVCNGQCECSHCEDEQRCNISPPSCHVS